MSVLRKYYLKDDGIFPNNKLPVLYYPNILSLPPLFAATFIRNLFHRNGWSNAWRSGIYTFHHYHSNTHEVMGVYKGETTLLLGGEQGIRLVVKRGDVLIIPAGVAHRNLGGESDVKCVGAYPNGLQYDMRYGKTEDRPAADITIENIPKPEKDPVLGKKSSSLIDNWQV